MNFVDYCTDVSAAVTLRRCSYGPCTNHYRNFNPFTLNVLLLAFKAIAFNAREMNETERLRITHYPSISLSNADEKSRI